MFLVTFWLFLRKCLYPLQMYNIQISKNKKTRNYRFKMVVSIANLQYWADSKSIKFLFLNIYLSIFYLLHEKQDGVERYPRASEVRARQFPSIGGFRKPDTVPSVLYSTLFPSVRISGNHLIFRRFQGHFFFVKCDNSTKNISAKELWNAGIPAYQGNSAQRHIKISKKYRGSRRS